MGKLQAATLEVGVRNCTGNRGKRSYAQATRQIEVRVPAAYGMVGVGVVAVLEGLAHLADCVRARTRCGVLVPMPGCPRCLAKPRSPRRWRMTADTTPCFQAWRTGHLSIVLMQT